MSDCIELQGASIIQHGKENDRIYLMKLAHEDVATITKDLDERAAQNGYTKIFAKVPAYAKQRFLDAGYRIEARVPHFFNGTTDCFFMGKYFSAERSSECNQQRIDELRASFSAQEHRTAALPDGARVRTMNEHDADAMAALYRRVFESYPFPIYDAAYIRKTMRENIVYFGIEYDGDVAALASSEIDAGAENVEMTDFATGAAHRGRGFAAVLLAQMEIDMKKRGIKTAYTISRALSPGITAIFIRAGYCFGGVLTNNTQIGGGLESMAVWHKPL